ncbi:hypothetical protein, partial [Vibrio parahaemolyticus]
NKDGIFKVNNINRKDILIRGKDPLDFDIKEIHLDGIKPEKCIIEYNSKKLEVSRSVDFLTDIKSHKFYYRAQKEIFEKSIDKKIIESIKNIVLREQNNIRKKIKKNIEEESPHSLPNNISKELVFQMILRSQITIDADELNQLIENDTSISAWVEYVNSLGKEQKRNLFSLITRNREEIISKTIGLNF